MRGQTGKKKAGAAAVLKTAGMALLLVVYHSPVYILFSIALKSKE